MQHKKTDWRQSRTANTKNQIMKKQKSVVPGLAEKILLLVRKTHTIFHAATFDTEKKHSKWR